MPTDTIDRKILQGAKAIARDLAGPAGQIALDRVALRHLIWFDLCQGRGMSWPQMAKTLHAAGAGRENGLPFTPGHLSAVVRRQRQRAHQGGHGEAAPEQPQPPEERRVSGARLDRPRRASTPVAMSRGSPRNGTNSGRPLPIGDVAVNSPVPSAGAPPMEGPNEDMGQGERIKAAMRRAADIRRPRDDDE